MSDAIDPVDSFCSLVSTPAWLAELNAPHVEQYFGIWAYEDTRFLMAVEQVRLMDLRAHMAEVRAASGDSSGKGYQILDGGIAVFGLHGMMMKHVSSMSAGTSTALMRRAIRSARTDDNVQGGMLHIDSPGGTAAGTGELADDFAEFARVKPFHGWGEDLVASAAFWAASQTSRFTAGPRCLVGSIGTYSVVHDLSGMAAKAGAKVHVVRAGKFKGAGVPGSEITAEQLAEWQRIVDAINEHFLAGVAAGRRMPMERVRELADGRAHMAAEAHKLGLIDGVESFDQAMANLRSVIGSKSRARMAAASSKTENTAMAEKENQPVAATIGELKTALPDSDATFQVGCLEKNLTLAQAKDAWMEHLTKQNRALAEENKGLKASTAAKGGVDPLGGAGKGADAEESGDAIERFNAAIEKKMAIVKDRDKAVMAVAGEDPELHQAYLMAINPTKRAQRLIAEKYE